MKVNYTKQRRAASMNISPLRINSAHASLTSSRSQHSLTSPHLLLQSPLSHCSERQASFHVSIFSITFPAPYRHDLCTSHNTLVYASGLKYSYHHPTLQLI